MSLQDQSTNILKFKAELLRRIIDEYADDPRVGEPKRQLKIIEDELNFRKDRDENKKQDKDSDNLVVGLRTLKMRGSSSLKK